MGPRGSRTGVRRGTVLLVGLALLPVGLMGQGVEETALVRGRVVDYETGAPLGGVSVALVPEAGALAMQLSADDGVFAFPPLVPGLYRLRAELLGYAPFSDTLRLDPASTVTLTLPLSVEPVVLEPAVVVARRYPPGPLQGFQRRSEILNGTFLDRQAIERSNAQEFTDLLRNVPGVRLVPTASFGNTLYFRGGCVPDIWLDGARVQTNRDIDDFLRPDDLEAVEVYRGPEVPGEFGNNLCGAVVAWSRRGSLSTERRSLKRQLLIAAGFVVIIILAR